MKTGMSDNANATPFQQAVWNAIAAIPRGHVATYAQIAQAIRKPKAIRAVGNACNANPYSPRIPCHRVVASNGALGGYARGTAAKKKLLAAEHIRVQNNKIMDFQRVKIKPSQLKLKK